MESILIIIDYISPYKNILKIKYKKVTAVGFEPTLRRTSALSWRLRPLGHTVLLLTTTLHKIYLAISKWLTVSVSLCSQVS